MLRVVIHISLLLLLGWFMTGCGLPKAVVTKKSVPVDEKVDFTISVIDGVLQEAEVQLVSLKLGILSDTFLTNKEGNVTLKVSKSKIAQLEDDDLLFVYASSSNNTQLSKEFVRSPLQVGQVQFRSLLPRANQLKRSAELFNPITKDPTIGQLCQVSHFTNARTVIMENFLLQDGLISEPIKPSSLPGIELTSNLLQNINLLVESIDQDLAISSSIVAQKFKLITLATKAIVERGISTILLAPSSNWTLSDSDKILFELAKPAFNGLHPSFEAQLESLESEITSDLDSGVFPFMNDFSPSLTQITLEEAKDSVQAQFTLETAVSLVPSLTSTTPIEPKVHFQYRSLRMKDLKGILPIEPSLIPTSVRIVAPELDPNSGS